MFPLRVGAPERSGAASCPQVAPRARDVSCRVKDDRSWSRPTGALALTVIALTATACRRLPDRATRHGCAVLVSVHGSPNAKVEVDGQPATYSPSVEGFTISIPLENLASASHVAVVTRGWTEKRFTLPIEPLPGVGKVTALKDGLCAKVTRESAPGEARPEDVLEEPSGERIPTTFASGALRYRADVPAATEVRVQGKPATSSPGGFFFTIDPATLALSARSDALFAPEPAPDLEASVPLSIRTASQTFERPMRAFVKRPGALRRLAAERLREVANGKPLPGAPDAQQTLAVVRGQRWLSVGDAQVSGDEVVWVGPPGAVDRVRWVAVDLPGPRRRAEPCTFGSSVVGAVLSDSRVVVADAHTGHVVEERTFSARRGACPSTWTIDQRDPQPIVFDVDTDEITSWAKARVARER